MNKLINFLLYAGLNKDDYEKIKEEFRRSNRNTIIVLSSMLIAIFASVFLISINLNLVSGLRYFYLFGAGFETFILLAAVFAKRASRFVKFLIEVLFVLFLYAIGIVLGSYGKSDSVAVSFIVMVVLLPQILNERPVYGIGVMLAAEAVFIFMSRKFKTPELAELDMLHSMLFGFISIIMNTNALKNRAKGALAVLKNKVLFSMAKIYTTMHLIDLEKNSFFEYTAVNYIKNVDHKDNDASDYLKNAMYKIGTEDCLDDLVEFTDLKTLPERLEGKKLVSADFKSKFSGWFRALFIPIEYDSEGKLKTVIFASLGINEEKNREQLLIQKSNFDQLTGLYNRRAYCEDTEIYENGKIPENFVLLSLDVNGLKTANDSIGHSAGDELLKGSAECMQKSFEKYGKVYRTGGDEFQAVISADKEKLHEILADFDRTVSQWHGEVVPELSISYGYVLAAENPGKYFTDLQEMADKRMYESKAIYYAEKGINRRGNQAAYEALCRSYRKVLKVNLTDDSFSFLQVEKDEMTSEKGYADTISQWFKKVAESGLIYSEDKAQFLEKTDINYLRNYFASGNQYFSIYYKRHDGNDFVPAMMEMMTAADYSPENQTVYLYVKKLK